MTSSGIKRVLAASAISALAVTGAPFIASSAQAATGDSFTVTYTGPALNADTGGALVILRAKDGTIDPTQLALTSTSSTQEGSQNNADQTAEIVDYYVEQDTAPGQSAYEFIKVYISTETNPVGATATFRIFEDDSPQDGFLETPEARQTVSITTAGPVDHLTVTGPSNSSQPSGQESGEYTVTAFDASNRVTQLPDGDGVCYTQISGPGATTFTETGPDTDDPNDGEMYATNSTPNDSDNPHEFARGTDTFTTNNSQAGSYQYRVYQCSNFPSQTSGPNATASNNTTQSADLNSDEIDIVTAADDWNGYGDGFDGGTTEVRVDQNTIRIDIDTTQDNNPQPGAAVQATVDGNGLVTFNGGQSTATYSTVLDQNGRGSITIQVDQASIQEGDTFDLSMNNFDQTIDFERAAPSDVMFDQDPYFCATGGDCTLTGTVTDQFGNPVTSGRVEVYRTGPRNDDTTPAYTPVVAQVGSDGKFSATLHDNAENPGATNDNVEGDYYTDQAAVNPASSGSTDIEYRANGQGADYNTVLNGQDTGAATYDPSKNTIAPLSDTVADNDGRDEEAPIVINNCDPADPTTTVSVDNGALILEPGETDLSEGSSSVTDDCNSFQNFGGPNDLFSYRVIGTDAGLVTVTVDSANRTETAQLTVTSPNLASEARNVSVTGPATVEHGTTQFTDTVLVTDAFGNPVQGVKLTDLNVQVSGPGSFKDGDVQTDANGMLNINISVQSGAEGDITVKVTGVPSDFNQFGAGADDLHYNTTDDGMGLPASSNTGTATTTVGAATPPPVRVNPSLVVRGRDNGAKDDKLVARALNLTAGATVRLYKKTPAGLKLLQTATMNDKGNHKFASVKDRNGNARTKYIVKVDPTSRTYKGSGGRKVR